ncbi:hypothetical protein EHQ81_12670 [Leptospira selangorensis]|uniref:Lipoprotein n=1 Tax=Leptospira selangorensis TaxID=2484982 RepID=A0A5F2C9X5_9LEPT|nr:hypothetical protein [Leptospira selangorensis]TGM12739.1 hypothetical protein EHQ81_12670 [Leptospira selangorensis]TGM30800.1 hypothetical protein EHQ82_00510 [Leptospira selangorensis]
MKKFIIFLPIVCLTLSCVTTAGVTEMIVWDSATNKKVADRIYISDATGGEMTVPWGTPTITDRNFTRALKDSIVNSGLCESISANMSDDWTLSAAIMKLENPSFGAMDFTHKLTVRYILKNKGTSVFNELIEAQGIGKFSDQRVALYRGQMATEAAAQENIRKFLAELEKKLNLKSGKPKLIK